MQRGIEVHGEVSSADASAGVALTLYESGSTTARTLKATETLVLTDVLLVSATGGDVKLVADTDAAGRRIVKGTVAANGGISMSLYTPHYCPVGVVPKVIAPAGQVDCCVQGFIVQA